MVKINAKFLEFILGGAYSFELENGDIIIFEQINKSILTKYDLKSNEFKNKNFEITYTEVFDDEDSEDFLMFKLEKIRFLDGNR